MLVPAVLLAASATARAQDFAPPEMPGAIVRPRPRPPCGVETRVRGKRTREGIVLEVWLRNRTKAAAAVTMRNACPGGPAQIYGLPRGYDVYSACNRGACSDTSPVHVVLAAGSERMVGSTTIHPQGDTCNGALPAGSYEVVAVPLYESVEAETCSVSPYHFEIREGAPPPPPAPPPPAPPPPSPGPGPKRPSPIPCALGCPNGILDSRTCTCKKLAPNAP
jgi:hypothetical protein